MIAQAQIQWRYAFSGGKILIFTLIGTYRITILGNPHHVVLSATAYALSLYGRLLYYYLTMANLMNSLNPRLSLAHAALYCEEYVRWAPLVQKPEFVYRRMHEESVGRAAFDWFGRSVIKAIITYVAFLTSRASTH